jgi:uncharacterized protein YqhQ
LECFRRKKWAKKRNASENSRKKRPVARVVVSFLESKLAKARMLNFKYD